MSMTGPCTTIRELREHLVSLPPGPIRSSADVEKLLAVCWDEFRGSSVEGMTAWKLRGRVEGLTWQPPVLRFNIERHGGTVHGSTRGERHQWSVDLDTMTADCVKVGYVQLKSMQAKLDVRTIADEIARAITSRQPDERLKWSQDGSVRVLIGEILPTGSAFAQTLEGRRRRFRNALDEQMRAAGWLILRANVYSPERP